MDEEKRNRDSSHRPRYSKSQGPQSREYTRERSHARSYQRFPSRSRSRSRSRHDRRSKRDQSSSPSHRSKSKKPHAFPRKRSRSSDHSARRSSSKKAKKKDEALEYAQLEITKLLKEYTDLSKGKKKTRVVDEHRIVPVSYFKPGSSKFSFIENYVECRICRTYYYDTKDDANKHLSLHSKQTFCTKIPTDTWYFDIEEVIEHFARMNFSKEDLKKKITDLDLLKYPESLVGFSCLSCLGTNLHLDCSTEEEYRSHIKNICNDKSADAEDRRIPFCRGCHNRFKSKADLLTHVRAETSRRCFPNQSVVDRIYANAVFLPSNQVKERKVKEETIGALNPIKPYNCNDNISAALKEFKCAGDGKENFSSIPDDPRLSSPSVNDFIGFPESSSDQPTSFNVYNDLHTNWSTETLQNILQSAQASNPILMAAPGGDDELQSLYVTPAPKSVPMQQWHSPVETPASISEQPVECDLALNCFPPDDISAGENIASKDDDDEVIEIENTEDCRLNKCFWNGLHAPSCRRLVISRRCGSGLCKKNDLHQWYGFSGNKFAQEDPVRQKLLCPKLKLYANCKYNPNSRNWDVLDNQVLNIPLVRSVNYDLTECVDPRLEVGTSYPRNRTRFLGKVLKLQ